MDAGERMDRELKQMLEEIRQEYLQTFEMTGLAKVGPAVKFALQQVDRCAYLPDTSRKLAHKNYPLPIGYDQTISQPFIVALMTDLLNLTPASKVLEIGTGCGYQTAILAEIAAQVHSIEIIEPLAEMAKLHLTAAGYQNIHLKQGDGYHGWEEAAPFDGIIVTACANKIPPALLRQLAPGGRLILPISGGFNQELVLVKKSLEGDITRQALLGVRFVPLTRG